jgi:hypothetical protein
VGDELTRPFRHARSISFNTSEARTPGCENVGGVPRSRGHFLSCCQGDALKAEEAKAEEALVEAKGAAERLLAGEEDAAAAQEAAEEAEEAESEQEAAAQLEEEAEQEAAAHKQDLEAEVEQEETPVVETPVVETFVVETPVVVRPAVAAAAARAANPYTHAGGFRPYG